MHERPLDLPEYTTGNAKNAPFDILGFNVEVKISHGSFFVFPVVYSGGSMDDHWTLQNTLQGTQKMTRLIWNMNDMHEMHVCMYACMHETCMKRA